MFNLNDLPVLGAGNKNWFSNVPTWYKVHFAITATGELTVTGPCGTQTITSFAAGLVEAVVALSLPARAYIEGWLIKPSLIFAGNTTLTVAIGTTGTADLLVAAFDLMAAVSATNFGPASTLTKTVGTDTMAATDVEVEFTATVANLDQTTQGEFDLWLKIAVLP